MKLFQSIQLNLAVLGIFPNHSMQTQYGFNVKIFKVAFFQGLYGILSCLFFVYEAHTFREYTDTIYMTSATIMVMLYFLILLVKRTKFFEFVNRFEKFVNDRESKWRPSKFYFRLNAEIKLSNLFFQGLNVHPRMRSTSKRIGKLKNGVKSFIFC